MFRDQAYFGVVLEPVPRGEPDERLRKFWATCTMCGLLEMIGGMIERDEKGYFLAKLADEINRHRGGVPLTDRQVHQLVEYDRSVWYRTWERNRTALFGNETGSST